MRIVGSPGLRRNILRIKALEMGSKKTGTAAYFAACRSFFITLYECILLITFNLVNSSRSFSSRALEMSLVSAS